MFTQTVAVEREAAVLFFSGHRFDPIGHSAPPRFPITMRETVRRKLEQCLDGLSVLQAYTSLASGSDSIFVELMIERGIRPQIVLPYADRVFVQKSVSDSGLVAISDFYRLKKSCDVVYLTDDDIRSAENRAMNAFEFSNRVLMTQAINTARDAGAIPIMLAVLSKRSKSRAGGTLDAAHRWTERGLRLVELSCN